MIGQAGGFKALIMVYACGPHYWGYFYTKGIGDITVGAH